MNPLFHTEFSISDSLKNVRKSVLIYETIIDIELLKGQYRLEIRFSVNNPASVSMLSGLRKPQIRF